MAASALAWLAGIGLQMQQPALWPLVGGFKSEAQHPVQ
jgi:hypothetical protein